MELTPRTVIPAHWVVTYTWIGSRYVDSPFRFQRRSTCFPTYKAARDFADAPHPEMPDFAVVGMYKQDAIRDYGNPCIDPRGAVAKNYADRCTDVTIIKSNSRFK